MTQAELDALIDQATVDCYNDHEQITGLFTMIDEHLAVPFDTEVLGVTVTVTKVDLTIDHETVAICRRETNKQTIPILDLPLPTLHPQRTECAELSEASLFATRVDPVRPTWFRKPAHVNVAWLWDH